jgi:hypothetical protein
MPLFERGFQYAMMRVSLILSGGGYLRKQEWTDPLAASATRLKTAAATSNSVVTNVTSFTAQPVEARKIIVTPGGTTADVPTGDVVITGTNIRGETITDTLTFAANDTAAQTSVKAFKTVTNVLFPIQDGASATYDIGITDAMGLDRCMPVAGVVDAYVNGTRETTAPTVTFHATDVSKNTVDPNTALDASKDLYVLFWTSEVRNSA